VRQPLAVFLDPGYSSGVAFLAADENGEAAEVFLYEVVAGEGWPARVRLGRLARSLGSMHLEIPLGVMELGWRRRGCSAQSSTGLACNAGIWVGALQVARWEQEPPTWQKVAGWELEVRQLVFGATHNPPPQFEQAFPDAFDALGLMLFWARRNARRRSPAVRAAVEGVQNIKRMTVSVWTG